MHLGTAWADAQIDAAADVPAARLAALTELERRSAAGVISVRQTAPSGDDPDVLQTRFAEALSHRMSPANRVARGGGTIPRTRTSRYGARYGGSTRRARHGLHVP